MDPATLGKIGSKVEEAGTGKKVRPEPTTPVLDSGRQPASTDTVNLTSDAKLLERLDKTLAALPVVNNERVAEVKAAIENGDYQIDADAIAEAMLRLDRSFGE